MNVRKVAGIILLVVLVLVAIECAVIWRLHDKAAPTVVFSSVPIGSAHRQYDIRSARALKDVPKAEDTADAAAIAVFTYVYAHSHSYEYAGVILKWPGAKYLASSPLTEYQGMESQQDIDADNYPGAIIIAGYHTHPCILDVYSYVFSPQDMNGVSQANLPEYMADLCTGDIHYWAPGDLIGPPIFGADVELTPGKIVGHITVDGVVLQ